MSRVAAAVLATSLLASAIPVESQAGRQVKAVLEFQQQGQESRQGAQDRASGVIIQDGKARGRGRSEFNEAATEVIVPNGRAMRIGGATRGINQVTRQILGYREQQASSESSFILTATVQ
jgi:hypothetical protein